MFLLSKSAGLDGIRAASLYAVVSLQRIQGFSMIELLVVVALIALMSAMAVPLMSGASRRAAAFAAQREVAGQIRSARLAAVTGNRTMQVRFSCPAAGEYRVIEMTGDATIDSDTARCWYPWPDTDSTVLPNLDGPVVRLPDGISFGTSQNLQISTTGFITPLSGSSPATIQVTDGFITRQVTASSAGRIRTP
jgi:prepilin-type N-terminal cleavage/methylation domain-containing protein